MILNILVREMIHLDLLTPREPFGFEYYFISICARLLKLIEFDKNSTHEIQLFRKFSIFK